jgi:hypothetical protein
LDSQLDLELQILLFFVGAVLRNATCTKEINSFIDRFIPPNQTKEMEASELMEFYLVSFIQFYPKSTIDHSLSVGDWIDFWGIL